jgi:cytidine deaminase
MRKMADDPQQLLAAADAVMRRAHVPYSGFRVGAALRGASGAIHAGANVENASYSQTQCAEASAIGVMIAGGDTRITAVAIVAEKLEHCPPCGGCRQRLSEFADADTPVYLGRPGREPLIATLGELLPLAFDSGALEP